MKRRKSPVNSGYDESGASVKKNTLRQYRPTHYSAATDIDRNIALLRNRAYDLSINSPLGAAAVASQATGVIGAGLKLFPRIKHKELGMTPEQAREWSRKTKQEFEIWANSLQCDFTRRNNFAELQHIAFVSYLTDGDSFCLFRRRPPSKDFPYSLRLQIIEAGRVSNPQYSSDKRTVTMSISPIEMLVNKRGNRIVNGIEVTREGTIEAVWISNRIWNEPQSVNPEIKWQRVKVFGDKSGCRNILHICHDTRADQFRGVPYLAPVIETLKQVSRYSDSELTQAIIKTFYSIFFIQPLNNLDINQIQGDDGKPCVEPDGFNLGAGTVTALPRGVDVKAIDASNSHSSFEVFMSTYVKQIGAALNLPYEVLLKNFQASYSASKAALLQAENEFKQRKMWFIQDFCAPIYEQFLTEAVATGRIIAPGFFDDPIKRHAWSTAEWFNEQQHLLDVEKEINGASMRIMLGLSTNEREAAELNGSDYWENVELLSEEMALKQQLLTDTQNNLTVE